MDSSTIKITFTPELAQSDKKYIEQQLREFNNRISPYHLAIRQPENLKSVGILVHDAAGNLIGGLTAEIYWGWLSIEELWLDESLRGKGIGTQLLQQIELVGQEHQCHSALLQTYSFQARGFYEKFGWRVIGEIKGYPPGQSFFTMRKDFDGTNH